MGEVEQQFMQVGGHFDQLQTKMKTQGEETQDYIQNIEIQVDNFIKKKHRSTNDQDAVIKEIRDKVSSSNDKATLAVSHLDTFTILVGEIIKLVFFDLRASFDSEFVRQTRPLRSKEHCPNGLPISEPKLPQSSSHYVTLDPARWVGCASFFSSRLFSECFAEYFFVSCSASSNFCDCKPWTQCHWRGEEMPVLQWVAFVCDVLLQNGLSLLRSFSRHV